jgi:hypothetical protein
MRSLSEIKCLAVRASTKPDAANALRSTGLLEGRAGLIRNWCGLVVNWGLFSDARTVGMNEDLLEKKHAEWYANTYDKREVEP